MTFPIYGTIINMFQSINQNIVMGKYYPVPKKLENMFTKIEKVRGTKRGTKLEKQVTTEEIPCRPGEFTLRNKLVKFNKNARHHCNLVCPSNGATLNFDCLSYSSTLRNEFLADAFIQIPKTDIGQ